LHDKALLNSNPFEKARWPGFVDNLDQVLVDNIAKTEAVGCVAMNEFGLLISNVNLQS